MMLVKGREVRKRGITPW